MWEYDHRMLPKCFDEYFNRVSDCHNYATRSATKNKLSENVIINTKMHGQKLLKYLGPKTFNKIVNLEFYHDCKTKESFVKHMKEHLLVC